MRFLILPLLMIAFTTQSSHAWSMLGPSFYDDDFTSPSSMLSFRSSSSPSSSIIARQRAMANRMLQQTEQIMQGNNMISNRYDLIDDETKFQLSIDVPGIKMEDIDISLDNHNHGGYYLTVCGQRVASDDTSRIMSKFSQTFALDPAVNVDKFTATLDHGVLVVTAPKDMTRLEDNVHKIPIMLGSSSSISTAMENIALSETKVSLPVSDSSKDKDIIDLDEKGIKGTSSVESDEVKYRMSNKNDKEEPKKGTGGEEGEL